MRTSLLLLTLTLLVTVATACGSRASPTAVPTPTTPPVVSSILHFDLTKTHTITSMGLSMAYPAGWLRGSVANTTLISELNEDHDKGWGEGTPYVPLATQGYQVTLSVNRKADITQFSTQDLDALMDLYATFYSLSAPRESSIAQMFRGAPALRVTGTLGFDRVVNCVVGHNPEVAFLFCLGAPSEQALEKFMPTWETMLASIKPVGG